LSYSLSDFDYVLPDNLIAQEPAHPRDHSRLLIYNRIDKTINDDYFYQLGNYLDRDTTLVVNNSKVEKCRLLFDQGSREIFIINTINDHMVEALVRPGKKFRKGKNVPLNDSIEAEVIHVADDGVRTLRLSHSLNSSVYDPYRATPFPPYIEQNESLSEEYQTVYARDTGSKAAPTAGLHFTGELISRLKAAGYGWEEITLHVGLGTFAPVKVENLDNHHMHSEWYRMSEDTASKLNHSPHITAVGTTSIRVLESAILKDGSFTAGSGETDIFIKPGYQFHAVHSMITNFHLPKSTLLMLVAAFMGFEEMHRVYEHAIREKYRFYSFGDGMLIL
jgi:S-adenosylmethionine:tRNA ribosyltransferase-isomerase